MSISAAARSDAVRDRAALAAAGDDPARSGLARRQLHRRCDPGAGHAPGAQARHDHLSLGEGMGAALRPRARQRRAQARRSVRHRLRSRVVPGESRRQVHRPVRSELLPVHLARDGPVRSRRPRRLGAGSAASASRSSARWSSAWRPICCSRSISSRSWRTGSRLAAARSSSCGCLRCRATTRSWSTWTASGRSSRDFLRKH